VREDGVLVYLEAEGDGAADRLERRWFAAFKAASAVRGECEALLGEMERVQRAWNHARIRLADFEAVRDLLGEELARSDLIPARASLDATSSNCAAEPYLMFAGRL
jgi:hypothetical protein